MSTALRSIPAPALGLLLLGAWCLAGGPAAEGAEGSEGAEGGPQGQLAIANEAALRVNTETIGVRQVEYVMADSVLLLQDRIRKGLVRPEAWNDELKTAWRTALQTTIQDRLLDQLGSQLRSEIIQRVVGQAYPGTPPQRLVERFRRMEEDEIRKMRRELVASAGGETELRAALKRKGRSMEDWEADLRHELFRRYALFQSMGPVTYSPAAARAYYDGHRDEFRRPETWRLRRIRIPKNRFGSAEDAWVGARQIQAKLKEGYEFAALAASLKYDPPYGEKGGLLSLEEKADLPPGSFPKEEALAAKLADGAFSEPVEDGEFILIVLREQHQEAKDPPFEEVAERAASLCFIDTVNRKKREFFEKEKRQAYIEVLMPEVPQRWLKRRPVDGGADRE